MSNESMFSIPEQKNYPEKYYFSHDFRISLESNISEKLRQKENQKGLFDQLLSNQGDNFGFSMNQVRTYGSNPNDYRMNRMSQENNNQPKYKFHNFSTVLKIP